MKYTITQEQFDILQRRFIAVILAKVIDERIEGLAKVFSCLPGVVPVWSCSGHPEGETDRMNDRGHIVLAITEQGEKYIERLHDFIMGMEYSKDWEELCPGISFCKLIWCFDDAGFEKLEDGDAENYPVVRFEFHGSSEVKNHALQQKMFESLAKHLTEL